MKAPVRIPLARIPRTVLLCARIPRDLCLSTILMLLTAPAVFGQGAVPVGEELQLNTSTAGDQRHVKLSRLTGGGFVAVWMSDSSSGSDTDSSIQAQRYGAGGATAGEELQLNTYTTGFQYGPAVAALPGGGFVAAWESNGSSGSDTSLSSVQARRYDAGGAAAGEQLQVNTFTLGGQGRPQVAALADDGFVVVWHSLRQSGTTDLRANVQAQRFDAGGTPAGEQFRVNTNTAGNTQAAVTGLSDGSFVVVWKGSDAGGSDTWNGSIQAQRFDAGGTVLGAEYQVNTYTTGDQRYPAVAALPDGGYVVAWESWGSHGSDTDQSSVQGQRYAAGGAAVGPQFQVNSHIYRTQQEAAVAALDNGGWVVSWRTGAYADGLSIRGQRYAADGSALEGELQLSLPSAAANTRPSVAAQDGGGFAVAWQSSWSGQPEPLRSRIQGRRYDPPRYALAGVGGRCLDVEGGRRAGGAQVAEVSDGTPVNLYRCHGGDNQRWQLDLTSVPQRVVGVDGKCLLPGPADNSGDLRAVVGECGADDRWQLFTAGSSSPSFLVHVETGLCLDVEGGRAPESPREFSRRGGDGPKSFAAGEGFRGGAGDGTPVILFQCHGGDNQVWRPAASVCTPDSRGLCLGSERFRIDVAWRSFDGTTGSGQAVPAGTDDSGLLWFFENGNWEMLIKVLDGCAINDRLWVFAAATTTVEYTLTVTDTFLGTIAEYFNPLGNAAAAITDTGAFDSCPATLAGDGLRPRPTAADRAPEPRRPGGERDPVTLKDEPPITCFPSPTRICLRDRFAVEVEWRDYSGVTGAAQKAGTRSADSGLFWFFDPDNWEMLVKVLDACDVPPEGGQRDTVGRFWMLAAATTDVEYTLRVTDTVTGISRDYFNPLGTAAPTLVDTFETCP